MIDKKQEFIQRELYEQWLAHPITAILLKNLKSDKEFYVNKIAATSTDVGESDLHVRYFGFGIKNISYIIDMITDYVKFTKYQQIKQD